MNITSSFSPSPSPSPSLSCFPAHLAPCAALRRCAVLALHVALVSAWAGSAAAEPGPNASKDMSKVVVTLDGKAAAPAMVATINSQSQLVIYPYDWCAWAATHGGASVPKDAAGSLFVFDYTRAGMGDMSTFPAVYKVRPTPSESGKKAGRTDKNVVGSALAGCTETRREAISGTVTIDKITSSPDVRISGKINVKLRSTTTGNVSQVVGTFSTVDMRRCQAMLPTPDLVAIPQACQPSSEAPSGIVRK